MKLQIIDFFKRLCGTRPAPKQVAKGERSYSSVVSEPRPRCTRYSASAAAEYLGLTYNALRNRRRRGTGPKFDRLGRQVIYYKVDLDAWQGGRQGGAPCNCL